MSLLIDILDPAEGWRTYLGTPPPLDWRYLELWRREWPGTRIVSRDEMHPAMNVADLYWREP
jgi:hypothetical protein